MQTRSAAVVLVATVACGGAIETTPETLRERTAVLDPEALRPVDADRDPLAHHRPPTVACSQATWGPEGGGFEIQTGACDYAAFEQPLPSPLAAGDQLAITIWHDRLDAAEPATGHVAVLIGDEVVWEAFVDIPSPSKAYEAVVEIERLPPPDARLSLHLHNHGFNSWRFVAIDLLRSTSVARCRCGERPRTGTLGSTRSS